MYSTSISRSKHDENLNGRSCELRIASPRGIPFLQIVSHCNHLVLKRQHLGKKKPQRAMSWDINYVDDNWWAYDSDEGELLEYKEQHEAFQRVTFVSEHLSNVKEAVEEYDMEAGSEESDEDSSDE